MDNVTTFPPGGKPPGHTITDQNKLMEWLVQRLKSTTPQVKVANGHLQLFDSMVDEFREGGHYQDAGVDWEDVLPSIFETLVETEGWTMSHSAVTWIPPTIMARSMHRNGNVEMDHFLWLLFEALEAEKLVKSTTRMKSVSYRSRKAFSKKFGVAFHVRVKRSDEALIEGFLDLLKVLSAKSTFKAEEVLARLMRPKHDKSAKKRK